MAEDIFKKRPILGNRILTPVSDVTITRPGIETKPVSVENKNNLIVPENNQNIDLEDSNNMNTDKLDDSLKALDELISSASKKHQVETTETKTIEKPQIPIIKDKPQQINDSIRGNLYFRIPASSPQIAKNIHFVDYNKSGTKYTFTECLGSTSDYVRHNAWHINGATIWIGTSATGVTERVGIDPASGVTGLIPQATKQIVDLISTCRDISNGNMTDSDGLPYQFAVIAVLGGQDHKALCNSIERAKTDTYNEIFNELGIKGGIMFKAALYNEMNELFALEVTFRNQMLYGKGKHMIFLHKANDIGGGKSDESLMDGRLRSQTSTLAKEFEWWIAGLERVGGKIGSIETTLGGTARIGRYSMLASFVPKSLFASDSFEVINLDTADWVKENIPSELKEYRSNFATTLLRTVWGKAAERMKGIPVVLVDRYDRSMLRTRRIRSNIAILRHMFLGNPQLDLLKGDISDERIAIQREEAITENDFMTIFDRTQDMKYGPWDQQRRIRLSTCISLTPNTLLTLAKGEDSTKAIDTANNILEKIRSLATSQNGALPAGGFTVIDVLVPSRVLNNPNNVITNNTVTKCAEALAMGFRMNDVAKPLINLYIIPDGLNTKSDDIVIQFSEDQPGTNILIVSTEEVETHSKRVIMSNPNLRAIDNPSVSQVFEFGRLLGRMVTAHLKSDYHHCIDDGHLIHAFHRHYYSGNYGNRPNVLPGGEERVRNKKSKQE